MKKQQKKIEQVETHIKELSSWSQKGTCAVHKTRRCERVLSCKGEANGCASKIETKKRLEKELEKTKVETCERRLFG